MSLLEAKGITKTFPGVVALSDVDLTFERGEVHCIVGENGAGKSTLVKILTGIYKPDAGELRHEGETPISIGYVPQEINLFERMTVAENMFLPLDSSSTHGGVLYRRGALEDAAQSYIDRLKMTCSPSDMVHDISVAEKQLLQIARALKNKETDLLILDEPTASLTKKEIERLFDIVKELQASGVCIVFITHRLDEVMALQSRVSVLRNGKVTGASQGKPVTESWIVESMTGKDMNLSELYRPRTPPGDAILTVEGLSGDGFQDISFTLRRGEILGFAGLVGAGRSEILQTLFGIRKRKTGAAQFDQTPWNFGKPSWCIRRGIIYLSEERKSHGIFSNMSVRQNVGVGLLRDISLAGALYERREQKCTDQIIEDYRVKTSSSETEMINLSGGNQQKVLIGRSLMSDPKVIFFDEPTRGIDVNAKDEIYRIMQTIAEKQGIAIILVSSEIEELIKCSNRVISIYDGEINDEIKAADLDEKRLLSSIINAGPSLVERPPSFEGMHV